MSVAQALDAVRSRIAGACAACGRDPADVELLAISKKKPATAVRDAFAAGQRIFGENRVQELTAKAAELTDLGVTWHMVGSVQTNKVRDLLGVPALALLHSLDRRKLADHLQQALAPTDRRLDVLLQINATGEEQKHGTPVANAPELATHIATACPALSLRGVMAMGPLEGDPAPVFARVADLRARLQDQLGDPLPTVSLGMTGDLEQAIAAGSTIVRVGTAVFGAR